MWHLRPSYSIERPYPYTWFAPTAVLLIASTVAAFSWMNYISSAYTLGVVLATDSNATIDSFSWTSRWPDYFASQIKASCQPQTFRINSVISTNQTALLYTVTDIWNVTEPNKIRASSFQYANQPLHSCTVDTIQVDFAADDRTAAQHAWSAWGETCTAYVSCTIQNDGVTWIFNMTTQYDFVPPTAGMPVIPASNSYSPEQVFSFLNTDPEKKGSLWWGESLLSMYWAQMSKRMRILREAGEGRVGDLRKGTICTILSKLEDGILLNIVLDLKRHNLLDPITDITDPDFWDIDFRWYSHQIDSDGELYPGNIENVETELIPFSTLKLSILEKLGADPNVWLPTDGFAKSFYSTILTDLGQTDTQPNILLDEQALEFYTANFSNMVADIDGAHPGPANRSYHDAREQSGPLGTTPSVISTTYTCQIPIARARGSVVLSIFLADIVFVQAVWKLLKYFTTAWLVSRHPERNTCLGCSRSDLVISSVDSTQDPLAMRSPTQKRLLSPHSYKEDLRR